MPNTNGYNNNFLILPHWNYKPQLKGLSGIYLNTAIRQIANTLVGIFIPIYIYQLTNSVLNVIGFYLIFRVTCFTGLLFIKKPFSRFGPDILMFLANIARSVYFIFLILAKQNLNFLWIAPIFGGFATPLYWPAYHTAFASIGKREKLNKQVANLSNINRLISAFTPLIGGIIAQIFGVNNLFPISILILIISTTPIFMDEYNNKPKIQPLIKLRHNVFNPQKRKMFLSYFFEGAQAMINMLVWPLILFINLPKLGQIGGLTTFTLIISLIAINILSKYIKKIQLASYIGGNFGTAIVWLLRHLFFANPLFIIISAPIYDILSIFSNLPNSLLMYQIGQRGGVNFFLERESAYHSGTLFAGILMFILVKNKINLQQISLIIPIAILLSTFFMYQYRRQIQKKPFSKFKPEFGRL